MSARLRARLAELEEVEKMNDLTDDEKSQLADTRRQIAEIDLDASLPTDLTIERLNLFEAEQRVVTRLLDELGREIATLRGEPMTTQYRFYSYERWDGIISITYFWSHNGGGETQIVKFPESYFSSNWRGQEQMILEAARIGREDAERLRQRDAETRDRATYERLHKRFGETS